MLHPSKWIKVQREGLYCVPGKFYIDPMYAVDAAVVTHGHGDHARSGHNKVLASPETIAIMTTRYGTEFAVTPQSLPYHQKIKINDVTIWLLPAGHILGSSQVVIEYKNTRLIVSGDYKRAPDPTCLPFEVLSCDVFISEATFGLPVFIHPPLQNEIAKLLKSLATFPESCHLVGAYALGKCQRVIAGLRAAGYEKTIYLHGAQIKLCELYQKLGVNLGDLQLVSAVNAADLAGAIVLCPPSALHDRWSRKFPELITCMASGWMQIRARAKQKGIDLPLVISDHADWNELTQTFHEVNAPEIWITHGSDEALIYYAQKHGFKAHALALVGYEDEGED